MKYSLLSCKSTIFILINVFFLFFFKPCLQAELKTSFTRQLKVNLIGEFNGKGLETDLKILSQALEQLNCSVKMMPPQESKVNRADINIFFEFLVREKFHWANQNWFIPNPDWYSQEMELFDHIDLVLCKTRECERIFQHIVSRTLFLSFTSPDCYKPEIAKDYGRLFHLAGGSPLKGTAAIQTVWRACPFFPHLTIVHFFQPLPLNQSNYHLITSRLSEDELRGFQNVCGIHLCPSETEGFGHYILEAMSTGAVVVTTDAPPMNEFIDDERCLVPYFKASPQMLSTKYFVDPEQLKIKLDLLIKLKPEDLEAIGLKNRSVYLQRKKEFLEKLEELIWLVRCQT